MVYTFKRRSLPTWAANSRSEMALDWQRRRGRILESEKRGREESERLEGEMLELLLLVWKRRAVQLLLKDKKSV